MMDGNRLRTLLHIRPDESRMALLVALCFAMIELSRGISGSAADAMFFRRYGVEFLPYLYIVLGIANFVILLTYAAFMGRVSRSRFFTGALAIMAAVFLVERAAMLLETRALYPVLWLSVNIGSALLGTIAWNIAGEVCDTRQAKRLFPIFVSAGILGGLIGGIIVGPLAGALGTENLLLLSVGFLIVIMFLIRDITLSHTSQVKHRPQHSTFIKDIRVGFEYVQRSPLLKRLAIAAVLFSILYFSVSFPFGRAVSSAFGSEAELAGFLGMFNGISGALMFIAALLIANRLYARIGIVNALLILPITYLLGFVLFAASFTLPAALIVRVSQLVVLSGIGDGAYSTFFNVVPAEKRAQVRAFDSGVSSQIGTILSGVLLVLGERILTPSQIFLLGMIVAAVCGYVVLSMRRSYVDSLLVALRAGQLEVFTAGDRLFSGFQGDSNAIQVVTAALRDRKPGVQQIAAQMLAQMKAASAVPALIETLDQAATPEVQVTLIRALSALHPQGAAQHIIPYLSSPDSGVRSAALDVLPSLQGLSASELQTLIRPLFTDPNAKVRLQAIISLAASGDPQTALNVLIAQLRDPTARDRTALLRALDGVLRVGAMLSDTAKHEALQIALDCLEEASPLARAAACQVLRHATDAPIWQHLVDHLADPDPSVRSAASQSLRMAGDGAWELVLIALHTDSHIDHDAALEALAYSDSNQHESLRGYARSEIKRLVQWRELARGIPKQGPISTFLVSALESRAERSSHSLIKVIGLFGHAGVMQLVARSLKTGNAEARSAAVEALDTLGEKHLVKELLPLLEAPSVRPSSDNTTDLNGEDAIRQLLQLDDDWLKALAIRSVGELGIRSLIEDIRALSESSESILAHSAHEALFQLGETMETLPTVSLMERILLLKEVPLFAELSPDDLKQVAEIAHERWYSSGDIIFREHEEGDEMFIIVSGQVRVTKRVDGLDREVAIRGAGDLLGEMAIIDSGPRSASLSADSSTRLLVIGGDVFKSMLRERPEISLGVMRALSRRLREKT